MCRQASARTDPAKLKPALDRFFAGQWKKGPIPEKWDGHTAERMVARLEVLLGGCVATSKKV